MSSSGGFRRASDYTWSALVPLGAVILSFSQTRPRANLEDMNEQFADGRVSGTYNNLQEDRWMNSPYLRRRLDRSSNISRSSNEPGSFADTVDTDAA